MRADVAKVCRTRDEGKNWYFEPRRRNIRREKQVPIEELPFRESMTTRRKVYVERGMILRYLQKNLGRKWDEFYSELSSVCDRRNHLQRRLREELGPSGTWVIHHVQFVDGDLYDTRGLRLVEGDFYIHPITKTLEVISRG